MANPKISELTAAAADAALEFAVNAAGTSKKLLLSVLAKFINTSQGIYNVKDYGALGNNVTVTDAAITGGAAVLTSASNPFVAGDVGKTIGVAWCGAGRITAPSSWSNAGWTLSAGTQLGVGLYRYKVTFYSVNGETDSGGVESTITTTTNNQKVNLTAIPTGGAGTVGRRIYRTVVAGATGTEVFLAQIPNNTTTTYTDEVADSLLGSAYSGYPFDAFPTLNRSAQPLVTTILTFTSAGQVTLNANATSTVTSATASWGTDDTTAIHAARDAAGAATVFFPKGTYCATDLNMTVAGQTWRGGDGAEIVLKPGGTSSNLINVINTANGGCITNIKLNNQKDVQPELVGHSSTIRLNDATSELGFLIDKVELTGGKHKDLGATIYSTRDYVTTRDCYIHDTDNTGYKIDGSAHAVNWNRVYNTVFRRVKFCGGGVIGQTGYLNADSVTNKFNSMVNCTFDQCGWIDDGNIISGVEYNGSCYHSSVEGCTFKNCIGNTVSIVGQDHAKIINNTWDCPRRKSWLAATWGIELGAGLHYTVTGNNMDMHGPASGHTNTGIAWTGDATHQNRDNAISGNIFTNLDIGLAPQWSFGNTIVGNGIYNFSTYGLRYDSGQTEQNSVGDNVTGNIFRNPSTATGTAIRLLVTAGFGAQKININGNQFINCVTGVDTGTSGVQVVIGTGNVFDGCTTNITGTAGNQIWKANYPVAVDNDTFCLLSDHAISSVTATEVTGLKAATLSPGTYVFEYSLIAQSATATVSPMYGLNFTGTATMNCWMDYADASAALTDMVGKADAVGTTALGFAARQAVTAFSTTTPNMGHVAGVDATATNFMIKLSGILVVTAVGDLAFWHGSETATSTTIKAGSSLFIERTN